MHFFICNIELFGFKNIKRLIITQKSKLILFFNVVILVLSFLIVLYNIYDSFKYSIYAINDFSTEGVFILDIQENY